MGVARFASQPRGTFARATLANFFNWICSWRQFWGCSFFPSAKLSDKGECTGYNILYFVQEGRGGVKVNSILDSTRGFSKISSNRRFPSRSWFSGDFRFCRARYAIYARCAVQTTGSSVSRASFMDVKRGLPPLAQIEFYREHDHPEEIENFWSSRSSPDSVYLERSAFIDHRGETCNIKRYFRPFVLRVIAFLRIYSERVSILWAVEQSKERAARWSN